MIQGLGKNAVFQLNAQGVSNTDSSRSTRRDGSQAPRETGKGRHHTVVQEMHGYPRAVGKEMKGTGAPAK